MIELRPKKFRGQIWCVLVRKNVIVQEKRLKYKAPVDLRMLCKLGRENEGEENPNSPRLKCARSPKDAKPAISFRLDEYSKPALDDRFFDGLEYEDDYKDHHVAHVDKEKVKSLILT